MKNFKSKRKLSLLSLVALNLTISPVPLLSSTSKAQAASQQISSNDEKEIYKTTPAQPIQAFLVDKARYNPGEKVNMSLLFDSTVNWKGKLHIEVYHLNEKVAEGKKNIRVNTKLKGVEISWTPPANDFRGYSVKAYMEGSDQVLTAAIDVSSDWTRFPRYGYTTEFPTESAADSDKKLKQLTQEYYLNSFQFYDWMWRHDVSVYSKTDSKGKPILDKKGNFISEKITTAASYHDLLGRKLYPQTIKQQIEAAQKYNAAAMAYQMNYAARENYKAFGVKKEWGLFKKNTIFPNIDINRDQEGFLFDWVNPPTALYLQDPGNPEWQKYITKEFNRSVNEFGFDGMHLDQWGWSDNDYLYDYNGQKRFFSKDYDSLINAVKESLVKNNKKKDFVTFNMVGGNEGYQDVPSPSTKTDFDYSEIWQDKDNYTDLLKVVEETRQKNGGKAVVIAGYMNYKQATGDHYEAADLKNIPKLTQLASTLQKINGWVGDFGKQDEDQIIWTVEAPEDGTYNVSLMYGHDNESSPIGKLSVNNQLVENSIEFNKKTGWGNPVASKDLTLDLKKGTNAIKLQLNSNNLWLNVNSLIIKKDAFEKIYEAEDAELISCKVDKYGVVYNFNTDGDYIEFTVKAEKTGSHPVAFNYGVAKTAVIRSLYVNNELVADSLKMEPTGGLETFQNTSELAVPLNEGENKIVLKVEKTSDDGANINYMKVGEARYEAEKAKIGWQPTKQPMIEKIPNQAINFKQQGDFIAFNMNAEESKQVPISIIYKNSGQETKRSLLVNGKKAAVATLPPTDGNNWGEVKTVIYLYEGANDFQFKMEDETEGTGIEVDKFILNNYVKEAEQAEIGWNPVSPKTGEVTVVPGFTNNFGKAGQRVVFTVKNQTETTTLRFKYRTGNNPKVNIYVDGKIVSQNNEYVDGKTVSENIFSSTPGGWDGAMVEKSVKATIPAGTHEIELELASDGEYMNLDSLLVGDEEYQVEEAAFAPANHGITTTTGYVSDFQQENDFLNFEMNAPKAGNYDLIWRYNNDAQSKRDATRAVYVNDKKVESVNFVYRNEWKDLIMKDIPLKEGKNKVTIKVENLDDDGVKLDYLQMGSKKYHAESADALAPMHLFKDTLKNFGHAGDEVTFDVQLAEKGETSFIFTYSNAGAETDRTIYIDGKPILDEQGSPSTIAFKSTGNIESYSEDGYIVLPDLAAGKHKVTLKQESDQKGTIQLKRMTIGFFDEPSVRLMDAGLAAMGATHIELGTAEKLEEGPNMLAHEYYPNRSKKMTNSLKESMKDYYKFFTAYENLLFDSKKTEKEVKIENNGQPVKISKTGENNTIWSIVRNNKKNKGFEDYEIIHLVNLLNNDKNWRNAASEPKKYDHLTVRYPIGKTVKELPHLKVYAASPDRNEGQLNELSYKWENAELVITLPSLEYWEMIVIDCDGPQNKKTLKINE
ncbi:glycoside hydrolase family 66 protein [Niallia sp. 03133]|uniref:glycoside hydrolase family 66 protein n=1 Tax=Niallia sp. 03133 TaxID=3458060 RepID=UPI004043C9F7